MHLFARSTVLRLLFLRFAIVVMGAQRTMSTCKLTNVPGFFAQDLPETDPKTFDYIKSNFGLLEEFPVECDELWEKDATPVPRWDRFKHALAAMNRDASKHTSYRVLFLARHGQGFHNVAEVYYGTELWNSYWSKLDGNGTIVWADAKLTDQGIQEAENANAAWKSQLALGMPLPQSFYSSPLQRASNTLEITWSGITLDKGAPDPTIKEVGPCLLPRPQL